MQDASIGPYRVVERLGAGGMGEVYLAVDTRLNRKVALKYLSDPSLDVPHARERLLREARAAAQITHPNIVAIYDILDSDAHPCIVMEYAQGDTLARIAARGPMPCTPAYMAPQQLAGQPDNLWAISNLGAAYWMTGDHERAFAVYRTASKADLVPIRKRREVQELLRMDR